MRSQQFTQVIPAPPMAVYQALLDPTLIERWRVPTGMRATVHEFDARVGGRFRVSLTYEAPDARGKTSAHTDTYHGTFRELLSGRRVVEAIQFEASDPRWQGEMTITTELGPHPHGTLLSATHAGLPPGVTRDDNAAGWRDSLGKLAALFAASGGAP